MKLQQIQEALSKMQEKDAISLTHPHHDINHTNPSHTVIHADWDKARRKFLDKHPIAKQMFAKGGEKRDWQIRFPVELDGQDGEPDPNVIDFIEGAIGDTVSISQYRKGIITIEKKIGDLSRGIPEKIKEVSYSIGKFLRLQKASYEIINAYENDPFRANQAGEYDIIITGHPIDIYGGSTGRGWTSCMDVSDKQFNDNEFFHPPLAAGHLKSDINEHHHMVYLVKRGGDIDNNAIARTSFKIHHSIDGGDDALLPEGTIYGKAPPTFIKVAANKMREIFNVEDGIYVLEKSMYSDSTRLKQVSSSISSEDIEVSTSMLSKISMRYDELNNLDASDFVIHNQQLKFVQQIGNSIVKLNNHDQSLIINKLFAHVSSDVESYCGVEDVGDVASAFKFLFDPKEMFDAGGEISSDFYSAMISRGLTHEDNLLKLYFWKSDVYARAYSKLVALMLDHDEPFRDILKRIAAFKGDKLDLPINSRTILGVLRIYFAHPNKIQVEQIYEKMFSGDTATTIIRKLFEYIVEIDEEYEDDDELKIMVENFKNLVTSMITVNYKTLDLFRIIENESSNLKSNSHHRKTPQEWLEYAITIIGGEFIKIDNGRVVINTTDEIKVIKLVKRLKSECAENETVDRISELIQSEKFDMIDMFKKTSVDADGLKKKVIIYRNPETGALWFGHGKQPEWLSSAIANGKHLSDFEKNS